LIFTLKLMVQLQLKPVGTPQAGSAPPAPEKVLAAMEIAHAAVHPRSVPL